MNVSPDDLRALRKVFVSEELAASWWTRDSEGRRLTVEWGEPDDYGFYTPVLTTHYDDQIAPLCLALERAARHVAAIERLLADSKANPDRFLLLTQQLAQAKRAEHAALAAILAAKETAP